MKMPPKGKKVAQEVNDLKSQYVKEIRELRERLEALETSRRRDEVEINDSHDEEYEDVEEELDPKDQRMAKLLKAVKSDKYKVKIDVQKFGGNLNEEEFLDWISSLDNYFECEDIPEEQRVKIAKTKLKGHALVWWDYLQLEKRKQGKYKISAWEKMAAKSKGKFLDLQIIQFKCLKDCKI